MLKDLLSDCVDLNSRSTAELHRLGHLGGSVVELLPLARGMISGSRIESHIGLPLGSLLLPLPVPVSLMNK